jgi:curved DNA-binding protein CbpA
VAEIKRAFQISIKTYGPNHMATYGLFTEAQREEILNRVHEAYNILMDPERRSQCDEELRGKGAFPGERLSDSVAQEAPPPPPPPRPRVWEIQRVEDPQVRAERERRIREALTGAEERGGWSGALLKEVREIRGLTLDDIAQRTKIGRGHLKAIEEDALDYLPPDVYVKGFVVQISKVLSLDPERIVPRLMEHIRRRRGPR